jgi:aspartyl-tRNA(Asn)/glutamyl-tRNA(Gln) amidotransferase subunit A
MKITELTAWELSRRIAAREVSASEVTEAYLERIAVTEPAIRAYLRLTPDAAREQARSVDEALARGRKTGPLAGVPVAIKDNILTEGVTTTAGSRIIENFLPPYDATAVARLDAAGAVILGKTNLDEFAMGSSCEYSAFEPTRNPWNTAFVPGGSSGGSAAAVAAGCAPIALGSDTGGSIRQPAALCGVAGLKPTYGMVPRFGLVAFASSLDQIGPLGRDTHDLALVMSVISGHDENDSTSLPGPPPDFDDVGKAFEAALKTYGKLGAKLQEISLPHTQYGIAAYYIIAPAEASSNLGRYTGVHYSQRQGGGRFVRDIIEGTRTRFGPEVKRRIMLGSFVLSAGYYDAYYIKASRTRMLIKRDFEQAFARCDALLSPTTPTPAFRLGEKLKDPLDMYLCDVMNVGANLAGIPALSIPCGTSADNLPVGLQILGPHGSDARILRIGRAFEQETDFSNCIAPVGNGAKK